jgi:hypothetical protein
VNRRAGIAAVVEDQQIACSAWREIHEHPVAALSGVAIEREHARSGPLQRRLLRNQFLGKIEIEILNQHELILEPNAAMRLATRGILDSCRDRLLLRLIGTTRFFARRRYALLLLALHAECLLQFEAKRFEIGRVPVDWNASRETTITREKGLGISNRSHEFTCQVRSEAGKTRSREIRSSVPT